MLTRLLLGALAIGGAALPIAAGAQGQPSVAAMESQSAAIAQAYLASFSRSGDGGAGEVPYVYGPTVRFYGRTYTPAALAAEKRRAARRWPVRHYAHRPGTMRVRCHAGRLRCVVQSTYDYRVSNPATGRSARGSTNLDLGISFAGPRPVILYESGRDPSG